MYRRVSKIGKIKKYFVGGILYLALLLTSSSVWASASAAVYGIPFKSFVGIISTCFVFSLGACGCALGMSKIGFATLLEIARQPKIYHGGLCRTMLIAMALIEALCLYFLVVSLLLIH